MRLFAEQEQSAGEAFLSQRLGDLYAGLAGTEDQERRRGLQAAPVALNRGGRGDRISTLPIRKSHRQSIERAGCVQLTRETAFGQPLGGDVAEHELLIIGRRGKFVQPRRLHIAMTGRTDAVPATLRLDAIDPGVYGAAHEALAGFQFQRDLAAVRFDIADTRH
jgi:hypothetical protein